MQSLIPRITALPPSARGMRIGLFGGSFNPAHEGHRLVSSQVLKRLNLHAVWWLVTPGNPLKDRSDLAPLADRVQAARALNADLRVHVTGFEAVHGFTYTWQTLSFLRRTLPGRHFVWIMGADSFIDFHRWERWQEIAQLMPLVIYTRPGSSRRAPGAKAAMFLAGARLDPSDAQALPRMRPPAWVYLQGLSSPLSSSLIRRSRNQI